MQTLRFILAFAELLLSPAMLLYLVVGPKAMRKHETPAQPLRSAGTYATRAQYTGL